MDYTLSNMNTLLSVPAMANILNLANNTLIIIFFILILISNLNKLCYWMIIYDIIQSP